MQRVKTLARQGYTILLSSHNPQQALLFADRILALHGGSSAPTASRRRSSPLPYWKSCITSRHGWPEAEEGRLIVPMLKEDADVSLE